MATPFISFCDWMKFFVFSAAAPFGGANSETRESVPLWSSSVRGEEISGFNLVGAFLFVHRCDG